MPDNVEEMLSGLAHAVGAGVQPPAGSAVRRRASRRTAAHRVTASVLAVGAAGVVGGAVVLLVPNGTPRPPAAVRATTSTSSSTAPTMSPSSAATSAPHTSTPAISKAPDTATTTANVGGVPLSQLTGVWKPADGEERALVVLPDGEIGLGQAGGYGYPMCAGSLGSASGDSFPVTVECGDWGTSGLSLSMVGGSELVLRTPDTNVTWVRDTLPATIESGSGSTLPSWLTGTWAPQQNTSYETFVVSSSGSMTWSLEKQTGGYTTGTATITSIGGSEYTARTTIAGQAMFWLFEKLSGGGLEVVGGYGPNAYSHPVQ